MKNRISYYTIALIIIPSMLWTCHLVSYLPLELLKRLFSGHPTAPVTYIYFAFGGLILTIPLSIFFGVMGLRACRVNGCSGRKLTWGFMVSWLLLIFLYVCAISISIMDQ